MGKKQFSKYERGVLSNLCIEGISNWKKELFDIIKDANCKDIWKIADLRIIEIKEAQCFIDKLNSLEETNEKS